ncbi:endonuclease III [Candidatus Woesearchaeota archaeon]|nr:endonuclease III [Candidatus Woesearchaeota archaeon]
MQSSIKTETKSFKIPNPKAVENIGFILKQCLKQARALKAPVFRFESQKTNLFQTLIKIILSSRTKDEVTLRVTEQLFKKVKQPEDLLRISEEELALMLKPVAFYNNKARALKKLAELLIKRYDKKIPESIQELTKLPGVGVKTSSVFLGLQKQQVIAVDVHVHRIANRLGLVQTKNPEQTRKALMQIIPKKYWNKINKAFVGFGQTICKARKPLCDKCLIAEYCYYKNNLQP